MKHRHSEEPEKKVAKDSAWPHRSDAQMPRSEPLNGLGSLSHERIVEKLRFTEGQQERIQVGSVVLVRQKRGTIEFEWEEENAKKHWRKHKISFEDAQLAFFDPFAFSEQDRFENGEERWKTVGMVKNHLLVCVAHTIRDVDSHIEIIKIISVREANQQETRHYGNRKV